MRTVFGSAVHAAPIMIETNTWLALTHVALLYLSGHRSSH